MKKVTRIASIVAVGLCAALIVVAEDKPAANGVDGWTVAYKAELKEAKLPKEWTVLSGDVAVKDGAILMKGGDSDCQITLTNPKMPGSVKVEFDGTLTGDKICDMSTSLNTGEDGFESGYLLQFAGDANKENHLRKEGVVVESTVVGKPPATAGKKHHVVAANDGGLISLTVDGKKVFEYKDAQPLKGDRYGQIGFYTFGCTLKIENLVVSKKDAPAAPASK